MTWWFHFVMGDIANAAHGYLIFVSDSTLAKEWPIPRATATRARKKLIEHGYLELVDAGGTHGKARIYSFEFLGAEHMRLDVPRHSDAGSRAKAAWSRAKATRGLASNAVPGTHGTELGTETTEAEPHDPVEVVTEVARIRDQLHSTSKTGS